MVFVGFVYQKQRKQHGRPLRIHVECLAGTRDVLGAQWSECTAPKENLVERGKVVFKMTVDLFEAMRSRIDSGKQTKDIEKRQRERLAKFPVHNMDCVRV